MMIEEHMYTIRRLLRKDKLDLSNRFLFIHNIMFVSDYEYIKRLLGGLYI